MKAELSPAAAAAADAFAQTLAVFQDAGLSVEVTVAELRELRDLMAAVLGAVDAATTRLAELAGPSPGPIPQHLRTMMLMGAGYFRHGETVIRALFRARTVARREKCPPSGTRTSKVIEP